MEGCGRGRQCVPRCPVVRVTGPGEDASVFAAICAGACGYRLKETEPVRLLECIEELHAGGAPMSPGVARRVLLAFRQYPPPRQVDLELSPRQLEILQLLTEGHSYKSCADVLGLSVDTVRHHVREIS